MLLDMLKSNQNFQSLSLEQREVYFRLADEFQDNDLALYLTPTELTAKLSLGNKQLWTDFLNLEPVRQYIKVQMAHITQIASRKAIATLQTRANEGDVQAAKQINELSGILATEDQNKVIILHQIARPKEQPPSEETTS